MADKHHEHAEHDHGDHGHHGHAHDRGWSGFVRYLRHAPQMWSSVINEVVVGLIAPAPGELVVDIGAGMGAGSMLGCARGATVLAIEPTPFLRRILTARARLVRGAGSVAVLDGAAEHLSIADASVDAIWSVNTMHHWVDAEAAAAEIGRVLRPGGRLLLVDEDFEDPTHPDYERFGAAMGGDDEHGGHSHGFSMVEIERIGAHFTDAGLGGVVAQKRSLDHRPALVIEANIQA